MEELGTAPYTETTNSSTSLERDEVRDMGLHVSSFKGSVTILSIGSAVMFASFHTDNSFCSLNEEFKILVMVCTQYLYRNI